METNSSEEDEKLEEVISKDKVLSWEVNNLLIFQQRVLLESSSNHHQPIYDDHIILSYNNEIEDSKVLFNDIERTRVKDRQNFPDFKNIMKEYASLK